MSKTSVTKEKNRGTLGQEAHALNLEKVQISSRSPQKDKLLEVVSVTPGGKGMEKGGEKG